MNKTDRDNWRKFLGIKDPQTALDAARVGGDIGKTAGRAGGSVSGGSFEGGNPPDGDDSEGAGKGDGSVDGGKQLKPGDDADRIGDLYDCETGENVKIDGLGKEGSEQYPSGFDAEKCKEERRDDCYTNETLFHTWTTGTQSKPGPYGPFEPTKQEACVAAGGDWRVNNCYWSPTSNLTRGYTSKKFKDFTQEEKFNICSGTWPAVDKNHLVWNKGKGCFEPLCPELNTAVSDKFKECQKEHILCDKDDNKVKVEVDGNIVKVTQAKYNQTAEIKNGKVETVKKLTESQTEAEFK